MPEQTTLEQHVARGKVAVAARNIAADRGALDTRPSADPEQFIDTVVDVLYAAMGRGHAWPEVLASAEQAMKS